MSTTTTKRQSVKSKTSKGSTKKAKKSKSDSGSKRQDNWRQEARALGKEKKYNDIYIAPLVSGATEAASHAPPYAIPWNPSQAGSVLVCNLIPEGNNINTRKDNAIKLRSLYVQGCFRFPCNASDATREQTSNTWAAAATGARNIGPGMLRVAVVYDEFPNATTVESDAMCKLIFGLDATDGHPKYLLTGSNIQAAASGADNQYTSDAFQNMRGQGRFRLLADERMPYGGVKLEAGDVVPNPVNVYPGVMGTGPVVPYSRYLKLGGIATHFGATADTIDLSAVLKGALYLISIYIDSAGNNQPPVFEGCVRLRFDD